MRVRTAALAASATAATVLASRHLDRERSPLSSDHTCENFADALPVIRDHGVAVISTRVIDDASLAAIHATAAFAGMPSTASQASSKDWRLSAFGRYHRITFDEADNDVFDALEQQFWPLVRSFFCQEDSATHRVYRSELQV